MAKGDRVIWGRCGYYHKGKCLNDEWCFWKDIFRKCSLTEYKESDTDG